MNILDAIVNAQGGSAVRELGSQFGLKEDQTRSAIAALVPALATGFQQNLQDPNGRQNLAAALSSGRHENYIESPASLTAPAAVEDGNGVLAHVFGSKEVSRQVAAQAATQTGLSSDVLKRMLPLVASLMMGAFSRQSSSAGAGSAGLPGSMGSIVDMLTPYLDQNKDGSVIDDAAGALGRLLGKRPS